MRVIVTFLVALVFATSTAKADQSVVIYGGTSAGVVAAVQVARMGESVVLIEPGKHVGGLTSGGLGNTDVGKPETISGITREFYQGIHNWYSNPDNWKHQSKEEFLKRADKKRIASDAMFVFEPHVAQTLLDQMLRDANVTVVLGERLDLDGGVSKDGTKIVSIRMESGRVFTGKVFLDCSYEGDLMAKAGVSYTVGREANSKYGEFFNGVQTNEPTRGKGLDPFIIPGDPSSGLIEGLQQNVIGKDGDGDQRVQAYNYRLCLTNQDDNRTPFDKPADYREEEFELLFRWLEAGNTRGLPVGLNPVPNHKTDSNKAGWVSTDYIHHADEYPDGDYAKRAQVIADHIRYTKGFLWSLANHPRVPEKIRRRASQWGYAADEFTDNGNFPHQLYVREGRRMLGELVMTEHELKKRKKITDPVALGSYGMDSHPTQLWVDENGSLNADTPPWTGVGPYGISYRSLTPKADECSNLLVPVCVSASHSAYGSLRMEPVYMMIGQAAGTAACLAIEGDASVQDVSYPALRDRLIADGQLVEAPAKK